MASGRRGFSLAKLVGNGIGAAARATTWLFGPYYGARIAAQGAARLAPALSVPTPRGPVRYRGVTANVVKHAWKMMGRERDTIEWLEDYVQTGDHLWDIGANIGVYSFYAAKRDGVSVSAFEPMPGNYAVLSEAILLNGMGDRVGAFAMGLSDHDGVVPIFLIDVEAGSGLHALDAPVNAQGAFAPKAKIMVPVMRGESAAKSFGLPQPTHIKIDVDGHEMRVLEGLRGILPNVRTAWIEMMEEGDASGENARIVAFMREAGFDMSKLKSGRCEGNRLFVNRGKA